MLLLFLIIPSLVQALYLPIQIKSGFTCNFNDSLITGKHEGSRQIRSAQDPANIYNWRTERGRVPYSMSRSVSSRDRALVRSAMNTIESHTCFRFIDRGNSAPAHSFKFSTGGSGSCKQESWSTGKVSYPFVGYVADYGQRIVFRSSYEVADHPDCRQQNEPKLLHELMHVLGLIHTQKRKDRDQYIQVHRNNIRNYSQYEKCENCDDHGVPYDCSSIMHYGHQTSSNGNGPTMTSKSSGCVISEQAGPKQATANDWKLLKKIGQSQC